MQQHCLSTQIVQLVARGVLAVIQEHDAGKEHGPGRVTISRHYATQDIIQENLLDTLVPDVYPVLKMLDRCAEPPFSAEGGEPMTNTMNGSAPKKPKGLWLSPNEQALYDACTEEWQTAAAIIGKAGFPSATNHLKSLLANLVDRKLIESDKPGYRKPPSTMVDKAD